jgi:hypothetical protein
MGDGFGFIVKGGNLVIKPQFDYAWSFSDGPGKDIRQPAY